MSKSRRSRSSTRQLTLFRRGGKRRGAGRKPKGSKALVSHEKREPLAARHPVLVTTRLRAGLPSLRRPDAFAVLEKAFAASIAGAEEHGFRLVHFSVQTTHLHVLKNAQRHGCISDGADPYSSGSGFDGWKGALSFEPMSKVPALKPRTWLLAHGWKRHGLIDPRERPGTIARRENPGASTVLDMAALRCAARRSKDRPGAHPSRPRVHPSS